jgi:transcriptional regulator with XRE-family HTH domain
MKKNYKPKPNDQISYIPARSCFCDPAYKGEKYCWQTWGLVIRDLREYAGMDQAVFVRLLRGYTRGQISRFEIDETEPPIDFWHKMMRTFGLNITWALTGTGCPFIEEFSDSEERKRFLEWSHLIADKEDFLKKISGRE